MKHLVDVINFDNGEFIYDGVYYEINPYFNYTKKMMEKRFREVSGLKNKKIEWEQSSIDAIALCKKIKRFD